MMIVNSVPFTSIFNQGEGVATPHLSLLPPLPPSISAGPVSGLVAAPRLVESGSLGHVRNYGVAGYPLFCNPPARPLKPVWFDS